MNRYERHFWKHAKRWAFPWIATLVVILTLSVAAFSWYYSQPLIFVFYLAALTISVTGILFQIAARTQLSIADQDRTFNILKGDT